MASATASVNSLAVCQCLANMAFETLSAAIAGSTSAVRARIVVFRMEISPGYNCVLKPGERATVAQKRFVRMTRRQLGRFAAGAALLQNTSVRAAEGKYAGPLDGFDSKVDLP